MKSEQPLDLDQRLKLSLFDAIMEATPRIMDEPPPPALVAFRALSEHEREAKGPEFFRKELIKAYIDKKWDVELHNKTSYEWLLEGKKEYKDDPDKLKAIAKRIALFAQAIYETERPFRALRVDVKNELIEDPEVTKAKKYWARPVQEKLL